MLYYLTFWLLCNLKTLLALFSPSSLSRIRLHRRTSSTPESLRTDPEHWDGQDATAPTAERNGHVTLPSVWPRRHKVKVPLAVFEIFGGSALTPLLAPLPGGLSWSLHIVGDASQAPEATLLK